MDENDNWEWYDREQPGDDDLKPQGHPEIDLLAFALWAIVVLGAIALISIVAEALNG